MSGSNLIPRLREGAVVLSAPGTKQHAQTMWDAAEYLERVDTVLRKILDDRTHLWQIKEAAESLLEEPQGP